MQSTDPASPSTRDIYSVTRLNREARSVLEGSFPAIWIQGEISNLARPASGHLYFSLKDAGSQVRCAMFKGRNRFLRFNPENGQEILARANISLYEGRGEFQLLVEQMEPAGEGALQRAFEELKLRLHKEGLFEDSRKKSLPPLPHKIGVITSPSGAAIRDILHVLARRYPLADVIIYPVSVQGNSSAEEIVQALATASTRYEVDILLLSRGGGSLEDLWSFNDERVARALYASKIPVITGIGHEIDFTIADFVADKRAPTPSAAAELAVPHRQDLQISISSYLSKLGSTTRYLIQARVTQLVHLRKRLPDPVRTLQNISQRIDDIHLHIRRILKSLFVEKQTQVTRHTARLHARNPLTLIRLNSERHQHLSFRFTNVMNNLLKTKKSGIEQHVRALNAVSPLGTLERGYAIVTLNDRIIRDANDVKQGESITSRVATGKIHSRVTKIDND